MTVPITKIIQLTTIFGGTIGGIRAFSNRALQISETTVKDHNKPLTTAVADALVTTVDIGVYTTVGFLTGAALTVTAPLSLPIHVYTKK